MARRNEDFRFEDDLVSSGTPRGGYDAPSRESRRPGCLSGCGMIGGVIVGGTMLLAVGAIAGGLASEKVREAIWGKGSPEPRTPDQQRRRPVASPVIVR